MRFSFSLACSALVASASALTSSSSQAPSSLLRRQSPTAADSVAYIPNLISAITNGCVASCEIFTTRLQACITARTTDQALAQCSCSANSLKTIAACAECIVADQTSTTGSTPISNYNGFVTQCMSVSLASSSQLLPVAGSTSGPDSTPVTVVTAAATNTATQRSVTQATASGTTSVAAGTGTTAASTSGSGRNAAGVVAAVGMLALFLM